MKKLQMTVELQRTAILHAEDVEVEALHYWAPEVDGDEAKTMGVHRISFYLRRLLFSRAQSANFFQPPQVNCLPFHLLSYFTGAVKNLPGQ